MKSIMEQITRFAAEKTAIEFCNVKPSKNHQELEDNNKELINTLDFWLRTRSLTEEVEDSDALGEDFYNFYYGIEFPLNTFFTNEFQKIVKKHLKDCDSSQMISLFVLAYRTNFFTSSSLFVHETWYIKGIKKAAIVADKVSFKHHINLEPYDYLCTYGESPLYNEAYIDFDKMFYSSDF